LLNNAAKYTPKGGKISLSTVRAITIIEAGLITIIEGRMVA
jgi:signal transduction histidine kinase